MLIYILFNLFCKIFSDYFLWSQIVYKKLSISELKENTNDVLTNERKTYYQDQGIDSLNFFYSYIFLIVYIIFIICFGIFSFIFPSDIKWYIRLIILISFIILPFVSTKLLSMVIWFFYKIYEVLPRNVHLNEAK